MRILTVGFFLLIFNTCAETEEENWKASSAYQAALDYCECATKNEPRHGTETSIKICDSMMRVKYRYWKINKEYEEEAADARKKIEAKYPEYYDAKDLNIDFSK